MSNAHAKPVTGSAKETNDEYTGEVVPYDLVRKAKQEEMDFFKKKGFGKLYLGVGREGRGLLEPVG